MAQSMTFEIGKVVSIEDISNAKRIKVRITGYDRTITDSDLPYCFPLIPKMFNVYPKEGESVFVFCQDPNFKTTRFYIGPIISQEQKMFYDSYTASKAALPEGLIDLNKSSKLNPKSKGLYPEIEDIALIGRKSSDIIIKDDEVQIRAGKNNPENYEEYNRQNPSYIQVKRNSSGNITSTNIVADNINLISHNSPTTFNVTEPNTLIDDESFDDILKRAHVLPYGDLLVEFMELFRKAFLNHVHPYPNMKPTPDETIIKLSQKDLQTLLSKSIRIN